MPLLLALLFAVGLSAFAQVDVPAVGETESEPHQTDDPAIWLDRKSGGGGFILGTIKAGAPDGAIAVYTLEGKRVMRINGIDRPNNIDVGYGFALGKRKIDIAVATERNRQSLRVFEIVPGKGLKDLASLPVFEGEQGDAALPMGVALYRRKRDGAMFVFVSRKIGPSGRYLWQYRLTSDQAGMRMSARKVREFGAFSGTTEIESIAVDAEREHVYYSDEGAGIRKYHADPGHSNSPQELALFGQSGWTGDREGIAIHRGYIIATDQQKPLTTFHVFSRDTLREVGAFRVGSDSTDGIDLASNGLFVAMNNSRNNFILARWQAIAAALKIKR